MTTQSSMNWDLTSYFPEFNGSEMKKFKNEIEKDITSLTEISSALPDLAADNIAQWEKVFVKSEDLILRLSHLASYVGCCAAADANNEDYLREEAAMSLLWAKLSKVWVEMLRAIKEVPDEVFESFISQDGFEGIRYYLGRMREEASRTMTRDKEILATDLGVDGINAWGRLYDTVTGKLEFDMEYPDGRKERIPISHRRSLLENPDRAVRRAAFEGGNAAWESVENVAAAALNAISGTRLTLNRHRGVKHFLEIALFQSAVTQKTLDAMFKAIYDNIEIPKRILRLKAKTMGLKGVAWYDLGAPLALPEHEEYSWEKAKGMVRDSFGKAYPSLGDFVQSMYDKRWIDWEPRKGKRPGGFCTGSVLTKESRIFMTYNGGMGDIKTLAHESGHAFHSYVMRELRPFAHEYPMTLAETASTFGEMLFTDGILNDESISDAQKAMILDAEVNHAAIYLMDIPVRYEFEKKLYEERANGELSVSRLKKLMVETQQEVFGDVMEKDGVDPYFWASKLHFYITGVTFYNFPYTFGFLLSRGLFSMFKKEGAAFLPQYEDFLKLTGSDTAPNVAKRSIDRDLETPEFWTESIKSLEESLSQLEELIPKVMK
jgi:oligoendopeptidase F